MGALVWFWWQAKREGEEGEKCWHYLDTKLSLRACELCESTSYRVQAEKQDQEQMHIKADFEELAYVILGLCLTSLNSTGHVIRRGK